MENVRVLIVDDLVGDAKDCGAVITACGYQYGTGSRSGKWSRGDRLTESGEGVDLILCDINMPVMDGLEFLMQIAGVENAKGIPIVMITTEGSEGHVVQALSCGARGNIRKPFTPDQVKEHVLHLLTGN